MTSISSGDPVCIIMRGSLQSQPSTNSNVGDYSEHEDSQRSACRIAQKIQRRRRPRRQAYLADFNNKAQDRAGQYCQKGGLPGRNMSVSGEKHKHKACERDETENVDKYVRYNHLSQAVSRQNRTTISLLRVLNTGGMVR